MQVIQIRNETSSINVFVREGILHIICPVGEVQWPAAESQQLIDAIYEAKLAYVDDLLEQERT